MRKLIFLILLSLINFSCRQKNKVSKIDVENNIDQTINESDYYNFFNDILDDKAIIDSNSIIYPDLITEKEYWTQELNRLLKNNNNINYKNKENSISESDVEFIFEQYSKNRKLNIDFEKISIKNVDTSIIEKTYKTLQSDNNTSTKFSGIYGLTLPLFSKNREIAFFEHSFYCGRLCASNGIFVYELSNGKWKKIGSIGITETS